MDIKHFRESLSEAQIAQLKSSGSIDEFFSRAQLTDIELPFEALEAVSGGLNASSKNSSDNVLYSLWKKIKSIVT